MPQWRWRIVMAEATAWRFTGRTPLAPLPAGWRECLVAHLGQRPRRLGLFTELALYGAFEALTVAGERTLPDDTLVRVCSLRGAVSAIHQVLDQARTDLPMPFSFLQSQPSQTLAALSAALHWQGDGSFMLTRDPLALLTLSLRQVGHRGLLLGWVEEEDPARSRWLRLVPCAAPDKLFVPVRDFTQLFDLQTTWLQLQGDGVAIA